MSVTATNAISADPSLSNAQPASLPVQTLNQDDFLKLLVTQLSSQDPLNPQQDTQFIAQMAQFTALQQAKEMATNIASLRNEQQFLQANALLGRTVALQTGQDTSTTGTVSAVAVDAGTPKLVVNGLTYDLSQVLSITPAAN